MALHRALSFKSHLISQILLALLLVSALIFGGASRYNQSLSIGLNALSLIVLFYTLLWPSLPKASILSKVLLGISLFFIFCIGLQTAPLPYELWSQFSGRDIVSSNADFLGLSPTAMPLSFTPRETVNSLLATLPAIAVFVLLNKMKVEHIFPILVWVVCLVAMLSILIGFTQLFEGRDSFLYFHEITNKGHPVGFFANVNHQASFLAMCLPIFTVLVIKQHEKLLAHRSDIGQVSLTILVGIIILVGVTIAGSLAGYILAPLMLGASFMIFIGQNKKVNPVFFLAAAGLLAAAIYPILTSPQLNGLGQTNFDGGVGSRSYLFDKTVLAIKESFPYGTGVGSFESTFPLYENPNEVTEIYMNHAHNDYLEWTMETGILFPIIFTVFMGLFLFQLIKIWREPTSYNGLRRAASLVIFTPLLHSLVDYPTRTPALAVLTAACLGIMFNETKKQNPFSKKSNSNKNHIDL